MPTQAELIRQLVAGMTPEQKIAVMRAGDSRFPYGFVPQPGPQSQAYYSEASHTLYGGSAGGGKSALILGVALQRARQAMIFRMKHSDIEGESGLWSVFKRFANGRGNPRSDIHTWWDIDDYGKRSVEFGAIGKPDARDTYQGHPHDTLLFDEAAQMREADVRYFHTWRRTHEKQRDGTPFPVRSIYASNPPRGGSGGWLRKWWAPWIDPAYAGPGGVAKPGELRWAAWNGDELVWMPPLGANADGAYIVWTDRTANAWRIADEDDLRRDEKGSFVNKDVALPQSYTFIPARVGDNEHYAGTDYEMQLNELPEIERKQMKDGDFWADAVDDALQIIPRDWVKLAQARWIKPRGNQTVVGVDVAMGGQDYLVIAPLIGSVFDELVVEKGVDIKRGRDVASHVVKHRRGNPLVTVDAIGWGAAAAEALENQEIPTHRFIASAKSMARRQPSGDLGFANLRAEMWWGMREALDPASMMNIALPPDPALLEELCSPIYKIVGDKIQVESKDELRERLGRSTDRADAVLQALNRRNQAISMAAYRSNEQHHAVEAMNPLDYWG